MQIIIFGDHVILKDPVEKYESLEIIESYTSLTSFIFMSMWAIRFIKLPLKIIIKSCSSYFD